MSMAHLSEWNDAMQAWVDAFGNLAMKCHLSKTTYWHGWRSSYTKTGARTHEGWRRWQSRFERRKELIISRYGATSSQWCAAVLQHLQQVGLRLIVASSATSQEMEVLLKAAQVDDLLDEITTSSDAEASKPSPDIVEAALASWTVKFWCLVTHPISSCQCGWSRYDCCTLRRRRCGSSGSQGDLRSCWFVGSLRRFAARQNRIRTGRRQGAIMFPAKLIGFIIALRFVRNEFNNKTQTIFSGYPVFPASSILAVIPSLKTRGY